MTGLTELWMSQNEIKKVPRELCENCTSLVSLRLNDNQIVQLPLQIGNLTLLEEIRLHGNRITILPLEMGLLQKVEPVFLLLLPGAPIVYSSVGPRPHNTQMQDPKFLTLQFRTQIQVESMSLDEDDMVSPTPEICQRGSRITLAYLNAIYTARTSSVVDVRNLGDSSRV
jgi:Leucine-rich repeat (LRR) protein